MEETEFERETKTTTEIKQEVGEVAQNEILLEDLPRLEDLLKSEKEISREQRIEGLSNVEKDAVSENRTFKSKQDEKKAFVRKRVKLLTSVYICVAVLLFGFVICNAATLAILNKGITSNTNTINTTSEVVSTLENAAGTSAGAAESSIEVSLNEPRDYNDDSKELTFLDKLTILFRNLFG